MSLSEKIKVMFKNDANEPEKVQEPEKAQEPETTESKATEDWIWITGFKGTDKDMRCRDYQFNLDETFWMPADAEIEACKSGFHMCRYMYQVQKYYPVRNNNRFFVVEALVRKSDYDDYGDKLAAKAIKFLNEYTVDQILEPWIGTVELMKWSEEDKKLALSIGIDEAVIARAVRELVDLGYSDTFAGYIINIGKYDIARIVASQPELSMDMKVLTILMHNDSQSRGKRHR